MVLKTQRKQWDGTRCPCLMVNPFMQRQSDIIALKPKPTADVFRMRIVYEGFHTKTNAIAVV